jgi:hypothetical protein
MTANGWIMGGSKSSIWIEKGCNKVTFVLMIPTPKGMMFALYFAHNTEIAGATNIDKAPSVTIQQAHERLGHPREDTTREMANALNWNITRGTMKPCEACAAAKAKHKNVPKTSSMMPANMKKERESNQFGYRDNQSS